jgi:predicted LPLAT superfamily acyltransferase
MSAPAMQASQWTRQRERSQLWVLRLMRWIALSAGRRAARLVLHPITLYFLITGGAARRESRRYLGRALRRRANLLDVYTHLHAFAATVLDRVYLLQGRHDLFDLRVVGAQTVDPALARGTGALLVGAHLGSFEALRALGDQRGLRVAMVMYEENARLINATLAAIAPRAGLHTIALGKVDAMLALRNWLDQGGVAGLLADRTLPGPAGRSRNHRVPFLGQPALFSDGPFRLAALLKRPLVFMTGLYLGGNRYELRFVPLVDFSVPAEDGVSSDTRITAALQQYVETLQALCIEAPYNWFNFFDFWADEGEPHGD